jgi:GNAT superfamily N-acetyltransferase
MQTFIPYDRFRADRFRIRDSSAVWGNETGFHYVRYPPVDYFNYLFFDGLDYDEERLTYQLEAFRSAGVDRVKLIYPSSVRSRIQPFRAEKMPRQIACLSLGLATKPLLSLDSGDDEVLVSVKSAQQLALFARLYLEGFASNRRANDEVLANFALLHSCPQLELFLIGPAASPRGVSASYYLGDGTCFLSACAVKPEHRNQGLQKKVIAHRLVRARAGGCRTACSWAYAGDISHRNLLRSGFVDYAFYHEGLSQHLDTLVRAR